MRGSWKHRPEPPQGLGRRTWAGPSPTPAPPPGEGREDPRTALWMMRHGQRWLSSVQSTCYEGTFVLPVKERSKYFFRFCYNPPRQKTTVLFLNQFPDRDIYCDSLNAFAASFWISGNFSGIHSSFNAIHKYRAGFCRNQTQLPSPASVWTLPTKLRGMQIHELRTESLI